MRNAVINMMCWIMDRLFTPILRSIGYSFTYEIKISDTSWIKPFIKDSK